MCVAAVLYFLLLATINAAVLDFTASAPFTYDHSLGGGAYNDRTIGRYKDVVESLQGGDFKCGDIVSFLLAFTWPYSNPVLQVTQTFTADSTGQSGVAFNNLVGVFVNGPQPVSNGDNFTGVNKPYVLGRDSGVNASKQLYIVSDLPQFVGTPFTSKALMIVKWKLYNLTLNDKVVVRTDVRIACNGQRATGNLMGRMSDASTGDDVRINVGTQTVPLKVKGVQQTTSCVPTDPALTGVEFSAKAEITTPAMSGSLMTDYYYSWSKAVYSSYSTNSKGKKIHKFSKICNNKHTSYSGYFVGKCGCELSHSEDVQPQLFYDPASDYYEPNPTQEVLLSQQVLHYVRRNSADGVSDLYLRQSDGTIVRAVWTDGTTVTFSEVVYGQLSASDIESALDSSASASGCKCRRRSDIVFVLQRSAEVSPDAWAATSSFAQSFTDNTDVSPATVSYGIVSYDSVSTTVLNVSNGGTLSNVQNSLASIQCTGRTNKGECGNSYGGGSVSDGIISAVNSLKASPRNGKVSQFIVIVASSWNDASAAPGFLAAQKANIKVIVVLYSNSNTYTFNSAASVYRKVSLADLSGGGSEDMVGDVCTMSSSPCGSLCCGICDSTCGDCQTVDTCPTEFQQNCSYNWAVQGSCCAKIPNDSACKPRAGNCESAQCDVPSGQCTYSNLCTPKENDACYNYSCTNSVCTVTLAAAGDDCNTPTCENGTLKMVPVTCTSDLCYNYQCVVGQGCVPTPTPKPNVTNPECHVFTCSPTSGWNYTEIPGCTPCPAELPTSCLAPAFNGTSCVTVPKCDDSPNECYTSVCNNGVCSYQFNCDDGRNCTVDTCSDGKCKNTPIKCVHGACSSAVCNPTSGACELTAISCGDGIECTLDSCDPVSGCVHTPSDSVCRTGDACTVGKCNSQTGCEISNITCDSDSYCALAQCLPFDGCSKMARMCNASSKPKAVTDCVVTVCDEEAAECSDKIVTCTNSVTAAIIGASLSTAAIVGIVIAGTVIGGGAAGGSVYAAVNNGNPGCASGLSNNPLYEGQNTHHDNPLHQPSLQNP